MADGAREWQFLRDTDELFGAAMWSEDDAGPQVSPVPQSPSL